VFADATPQMRIVREEIFGPVLSLMPFRDEDEAIALANDTPYGLASYVQTGSPERARRVAHRIRAGMVQINARRTARIRRSEATSSRATGGSSESTE
jgi:aldehyde dehydrogenase (NAD+)